MSKFLSRRYGDLAKISTKTDGRCHICLRPAPLHFYGPPGWFGDHTVTIDHLVPQAYGGDDDLENLRLAHATCNSTRGTRYAEDVRLELAGTDRAPLGVTEKNVVSLAVGGAGYLGGGLLFAKQNPDGSNSFNHGAATLSALTLGLLVRLALC